MMLSYNQHAPEGFLRPDYKERILEQIDDFDKGNYPENGYPDLDVYGKEVKHKNAATRIAYKRRDFANMLKIAIDQRKEDTRDWAEEKDAKDFFDSLAADVDLLAHGGYVGAPQHIAAAVQGVV